MMNDNELALIIKTADTDMEKKALWGKLLFGGLFALPMIQGYLQQQQQKSFMRGQSAMSNMLMPMMYARNAPQGALGMPSQYRRRFDLQSV